MFRTLLWFCDSVHLHYHCPLNLLLLLLLYQCRVYTESAHTHVTRRLAGLQSDYPQSLRTRARLRVKAPRLQIIDHNLVNA
jgi:hypothetical protein